jgi:hypothetical protein
VAAVHDIQRLPVAKNRKLIGFVTTLGLVGSIANCV